jgi:hypothetical protein
MHVPGPQHRLFQVFWEVALIQPPRQPALASPHLIPDTLLHSKLLLCLAAHASQQPMKHREKPEDFELS